MEEKPLYKILKDCKQGDWVYYDAGSLVLADKEEEREYKNYLRLKKKFEGENK